MSALSSQPGADYGTAKQQFLDALRTTAVAPGDDEGVLQRTAGAVGKLAEELRVQVGGRMGGVRHGGLCVQWGRAGGQVVGRGAGGCLGAGRRL